MAGLSVSGWDGIRKRKNAGCKEKYELKPKRYESKKCIGKRKPVSWTQKDIDRKQELWAKSKKFGLEVKILNGKQNLLIEVKKYKIKNMKLKNMGWR